MALFHFSQHKTLAQRELPHAYHDYFQEKQSSPKSCKLSLFSLSFLKFYPRLPILSTSISTACLCVSFPRVNHHQHFLSFFSNQLIIMRRIQCIRKAAKFDTFDSIAGLFLFSPLPEPFCFSLSSFLSCSARQTRKRLSWGLHCTNKWRIVRSRILTKFSLQVWTPLMIMVELSSLSSIHLRLLLFSLLSKPNFKLSQTKRAVSFS